jgi:hypothetical protein
MLRIALQAGRCSSDLTRRFGAQLRQEPGEMRRGVQRHAACLLS